jgi:hypothetical protein
VLARPAFGGARFNPTRRLELLFERKQLFINNLRKALFIAPRGRSRAEQKSCPFTPFTFCELGTPQIEHLLGIINNLGSVFKYDCHFVYA